MLGRQHKSECHRIEELMSSYIDGRLNEVERDSVEFHTEVCRDCRRNLASLQAAVGLLHRMPTVIPSRSFTLAEAPEQRMQERNPFPIIDWGSKVAAVAVPNTNWLRMATAAAIILLLVLVAGDVTGAFHSESNSETSVSIEESATPNVVAPLLQDDPLNEITPEDSNPQDAHELTGPQETGIAADQTETGTEGVDSPHTPSVPLPIEANELLSPTAPEDSSEESAYSWLRPVEITAAVIAVLLGGLLILARKQRRSLVS